MAFFFLTVLLSGLVPFIVHLINRRRLYGIGRKDNGESVAGRTKPAFREVINVFLKRLSKDRTAALLHHFIIFGTSLWIIGMMGKPIFRGELWRNIITPNIAAAGQMIVLTATAAFAARRLNGKVRRLTREPKDMIPLMILGTYILIGFIQEGAKVALNDGHAAPTFVSYPLSQLFAGLPPGQINLWANFISIGFGLSLLALFIALFRSKMFHMVAGFFNLSGTRSLQLGRLKNTENEISSLFNGDPEMPNASEIDGGSHFGMKYIGDMDRVHLSQLDGCIECGRCDEACPAFLSGKTLSPRQLILGQKKILSQYDAREKNELIQNDDDKAIVWDCNLCYACENACPAMVQHVDRVVGLRRNMILNEGETLKEFKTALKNMEKTGNPFGIQSNPADFYRELGIPVLQKGESVDYLLWLGCFGMLDARMTPVAGNLVRLLKDAGKTFGVLGENIICCGDPARRIGDEYAFRNILNRNSALFEEYQVSEILTLCPHCMNTFKNEYPTFGVQIKAKHYVEILSELLKPEDKTERNLPVKKKVFYHDSCYLARINNVWNEPRRVLEGLGHIELVSIGREKDDSLCCGGGGGRILVDERPNERPSMLKLAELQEKHVETVITSCPYCLNIFSDTSKAKNANIEVKDLLEVII